MVWVSSVMALEIAMSRLLDQAPAWLDRLPGGAPAAVDLVAELYIDTQATRCLGYVGSAGCGAAAPRPSKRS